MLIIEIYTQISLRNRMLYPTLTISLHHLEIQIQYALHIKAYAPKNLIEILADHWSNYDQYNKGKYITLAAFTKNFFEQDIPPLQNLRPYTIPPWHYKDLNINSFLSKLIIKNDTDSDIIKATTLRYLENFSKSSSFLLSQTDAKIPTKHRLCLHLFLLWDSIIKKNYLTYICLHPELLVIRAVVKYIKLQELKKRLLELLFYHTLKWCGSYSETIFLYGQKSNYVLHIQALAP